MALTALAIIASSPRIATAQDAKLDTKNNAEIVKDTKGNFARGAKLWVNRCSSCHNMRDPKDLTDSEWEATLMHMRIRAGLSGQDTRDILVFLQKTN
jgi:nitrate/TMAO reductase-like tetraheme cytochrome c subunit